jgi:hypothetical protein
MQMLCPTLDTAERFQKALTGASSKPVVWDVVEVDGNDLRSAVELLTTGTPSGKLVRPQHTEGEQ